MALEPRQPHERGRRFGGLLFWGWLWGGWGLVLGLPIMMVIKAICDHVEDFKPIGEFMAE